MMKKVPLDPDNRLAALALLTKVYQKPKSQESISSGLPIVDGVLDIDLFTRAARRAGLIASLQKRALKSILPSTLPVVLELHGNRVCILMKMEGDHARIIHPGDDETELTVKVSELESSYSGFCFLIKQRQEPARGLIGFGM